LTTVLCPEDWAHAAGLREGRGRQRAGPHSRGRISAATGSRPTWYSSSITARSGVSPDGHAPSDQPHHTLSRLSSSRARTRLHRRAAKTTGPLTRFDRRGGPRNSFNLAQKPVAERNQDSWRSVTGEGSAPSGRDAASYPSRMGVFSGRISRPWSRPLLAVLPRRGEGNAVPSPIGIRGQDLKRVRLAPLRWAGFW
jgi:hypothetical protein